MWPRIAALMSNGDPMTAKKLRGMVLPALIAYSTSLSLHAQTIPDPSAINAEVKKIMDRTHANGMAVAVVDHGQVGFVQAYGIRNAKGEPLTTDTVMYG